MGYLLVLLKTTASMCGGVLMKKYNAKHSSGGMFFTGILSLFAMLFFVVSDRNGFVFPREMFPYAIAYGLLYCTAYWLTFVALVNGSFTLSMLIISYSLVFPIVYGIVWLHDPVTAFTCIGFALLMVSLFLVRGKKDDEQTRISVQWVAPITITMIGNGVLDILQKAEQVRFNNSCNNEFMIVALGLSAAVLLIVGGFKDRRHIKEILRYGIPYAGSSGVINGINNLLTIFVNNLLPLSIVSPLSAGIKIVLSFLTAQVLFKEKYLKRQIAGVAIGTAALVFLNL